MSKNVLKSDLKKSLICSFGFGANLTQSGPKSDRPVLVIELQAIYGDKQKRNAICPDLLVS